MYELGAEAGDAETMDEADRTLADLEKKAEKVELNRCWMGRMIRRIALCRFTPAPAARGPGLGEMLLRMYLFFFENRRWMFRKSNRTWGEQAGIKTSRCW